MKTLSKEHFIFLTGFFIAVFGILFLLGSGRPKTTDEYMIFFQAESFWDRGEFSVPQAEIFRHWYGKRGLDGKPYAPYGVLHASLLSPTIGLGKLFFKFTGLSMDKWILAGPFIPSLFSSLVGILAACLIGVAAFEQGISAKHVFLLLFSFLFSTPIAAYGGTFFSEPLTLLIWTTSILLLIGIRASGEPKDRMIFYLGFIAALAGWVRPNQWIYLPVIFLAMLISLPRRRGMASLLFGAASASVMGIVLVANQITYGSFFDFGYPDWAESGRKLNEFKTSLSQGFYVLTLSPGKSFLLYVPVSILALLQVKRFRENFFGVVFAGLLAAYVLFFSGFSSVEGGYCFGPRFFLNLIPFVYIALLPAFHKPQRNFIRVFCFLSLLGLLINFPALMTSFLEEQVDGHYYGPGFVYQVMHADSWEQWKLFFHYLQVNGESLPLGMGWDLGFLFLKKAGSKAMLWKGIIGVAALLMILGSYLLFFGYRALSKKTSQKGVFQ